MAPTLKTVAEVLARLEAIDAALPPSDGVKWFNKLYLEVTQQVEEAVPAEHQAAPGFLAALDVVFAARYFAAFDAAGNSTKLPAGYPFHAWKPLFEARFATGIAPVQFALAGMNAHINHDLSIVICEACAARGTEPSDDGPEHKDYESVNGLIAKVEKKMKAWMMTGLLKELDLAFNPVDDVVAVWNVEKGTRRCLDRGGGDLVPAQAAAAAQRLRSDGRPGSGFRRPSSADAGWVGGVAAARS